MPAADSVAVHHGNDRLGHHADKMLQVEHVQARDVVLAHVAAVATDLLIAARAERLVLVAAAVVRTGQDDDADGSVVARHGERVVHLGHGERGERVAPFGAIDGDFRNPISGFVLDFPILLGGFPSYVIHSCPFVAYR